MFRKRKQQPIPHIKYTDRAHQTEINDDQKLISLYIRPYEQHPARYIEQTLEIDCLVANVDINNKGNIQGIEVILQRRPGQEPEEGR